MRFLIIPENSSLSHIDKALAMEACLTADGHEVFVAVSRERRAFLQHLGDRVRVLPDLQEIDHAGYPTVAWFRDPQRILACIHAELDLLNELRPDRVLGVFRFTLKASARLAEVPFDSLACGCMLPDTSDVLGFAEGDPGLDRQRELLRYFYGYAAARISQALESVGLAPIADIRVMLKGDRTFLWDFPAFSPLPELPGVTHVGPISWHRWPSQTLDLEKVLSNPRPLALLSFGTCVGSGEVASRMVHVLRSQGYQVVLAAGGQEELVAAMADEPDVVACRFAPLHLLFPHAALLVCHGGQLTVFEALSHRVPVLVMPFQAEQAHNGICLERIRCGRRLTPSLHFLGHPGVYVEAFQATTDQALQGIVRSVREDACTTDGLAAAQATLSECGGLKSLTSALVGH